ncbi:hypothetical protein pb186bvf_000316 [Paramecium bursaria]
MINVLEGQLVFCQRQIDNKYLGKFTIVNKDQNILAFKMKANHSQDITISLFQGCLDVNQQKTIQITCNHYLQNAKLQILTLPLHCSIHEGVRYDNQYLRKLFIDQQDQISTQKLEIIMDSSLSPTSLLIKEPKIQPAQITQDQQAVIDLEIQFNKLQQETREIAQYLQKLRNQHLDPSHHVQFEGQHVFVAGVISFFIGYIFTI